MKQSSAAKCQYRHVPNKELEAMKWLNEEKGIRIPKEGYVKFKVASVNTTNQFFINILSFRSLKLEPEIKHVDYFEMDTQLQLYFADPNKLRYVSSFVDDDLYAYKDVESSFFRRFLFIKNLFQNLQF